MKEENFSNQTPNKSGFKHNMLCFVKPAATRSNRHSAAARSAPMMMIALGSVVVAALLILALMWKPGSNKGAGGQPPLVLYCAAGLKPPVELVARQFQQEYGVPVQLQFGGSGTLLNNARVAKTGDLYLAADESYLELARQHNLIAESIPVARQTAVIAVRRGNPKSVQGLQDLLRPDVRTAIAAPDAASIGGLTRKILQASGLWPALESHVRQHGVFKSTVNDLANDVKLGAADAAIVWDSTVKQYPELELVKVPAFSSQPQTAWITVLQSCRQPTTALRFARYLSARDKGLPIFARFHYETVEGDAWAWQPELLLFSGSMLRPAIEKILRDFEQREGVRINTVYNGCGILTAQMRAGARPDSYFACDVSFMNTVADLYLNPVVIADNDIVIIVPKGNPKNIREMSDLTRPGLRVGLPHHEKSAMGALIFKLLQAVGLYDAITNQTLKVESPTGDFLVNQLRTGSLDAIMACRSNWKTASEHLELIPVNHPLAKATQPYAVSRHTKYALIMTRLLEKIKSEESRKAFEQAGFYWQYKPENEKRESTAPAN